MTDHLSKPLTIVPAKTDAEVAGEIKTKVTECLEALCRALDEANGLGFEVSFGTGKDWAKRNVIAGLIVAKHF